MEKVSAPGLGATKNLISAARKEEREGSVYEGRCYSSKHGKKEKKKLCCGAAPCRERELERTGYADSSAPYHDGARVEFGSVETSV